MIGTRPAGFLDTRAMAELLNEIITAGGTTALTSEVTRADIQDRMARNSDRSAWHVVEDETGDLLGFQWIAPHPELPTDAADIATFVRMGKTGLGTGSRLFQATSAAAKDMGYAWINATIRADNEGGLAYYQSQGFEDYKILRNVTLGNGLVVDKRCKRFDLLI